MPRPRSRVYAASGREELHRLLLALRMGPDDGCGFTEDDLRVGWELHGERIMGERQGRGPGTRPSGWWQFVAGEEQPEEHWDPDAGPGPFGRISGQGDETLRLAELGGLTADELAALREDANEARLRVGTDSERISGGSRRTPGAVSLDQLDIDLWDAVQAAAKRRARVG